MSTFTYNQRTPQGADPNRRTGCRFAQYGDYVFGQVVCKSSEKSSTLCLRCPEARVWSGRS